jgi:hypothetical protein
VHDEEIAPGEPEAGADDGIGIALELIRVEQGLAGSGWRGDGGDGRTVP